MSIRIIDPKSWHSQLAVIRSRPGMYLGGKTLKGLHHYVDGIRAAEHMYNIHPSKRISDFDWGIFEPWHLKKLKIKPKGYSRSFVNAMEMTKSDEEAFDLWFSWYDEYNLSEGKEDYDNWKKNYEQQELYRNTKDEGDPSLY